MGYDLEPRAGHSCNNLLRLAERCCHIFIAHDLSVVRHISDRIAVMYFGKIVEMGQAEELYSHPQHAYSKTLLDAAPRPDPSARRFEGRRVARSSIP